MKSRFIVLALLLGTLAGCKTRQQAPTPIPVTETQHTNAVGGNLSTGSKEAFPYRASVTKDWDLVHTKLEVSFDWMNSRMQGRAWLTLKPWFYPKSEVVLDAKGFIIREVALGKTAGNSPLSFEYDNQQLRIQMDRQYARGEELTIFIDYTARPHELDSLVPEAAAGDQGLYFINPKGEAIGKPRQVWTQGETHGSPGWFPTFDTPNQRCTQEIYITVADSFKTLSNGTLVSQTRNTDGTRTDYWKMDQPHAPYLFMMAVGNFAVIKDQWRGKEVNYYVEPAYAPYARLVFGDTPAMMEFFSQKLGVDYPWSKYSQVVVRDFVSGAMENTSATIHYGRLQHNSREHLDNPEQDIISHELFHQWFGDLVTCESWANLSLNEGFATYGEVLWVEHKEGADAALHHLHADRNNYVRAAAHVAHPIIDFHHSDADAMFDSHSYQKGGQVLHMLRKLVGEDAFFAALKRYLTTNAYDDVEIHELRLAFEEVTGQDLNWFFDQWFMRAGHPELELSHSYSNGSYRLRVNQTQNIEASSCFRLPIAVDYVIGEQHRRLEAWMETADTTFEWPMAQAPTYVAFDPDGTLLCVVRRVNGQDAAAWARQLTHGRNYLQKLEAVERLRALSAEDLGVTAAITLANDPFWANRALALTHWDGLNPSLQQQAVQVASDLLEDPVAEVRTRAVLALDQSLGFLLAPENDALRLRLCGQLQAAVRDSSYAVGRAALDTYYKLDSAAALALAESLIESKETHLAGTIAHILKDSKSPRAMTYIKTQLQTRENGFSTRMGLMRGLGGWLKTQDKAIQTDGEDVLLDVVLNDRERWVRFVALQNLIEMGGSEKVAAALKGRVATEQDDTLRAAMDNYLKRFHFTE